MFEWLFTHDMGPLYPVTLLGWGYLGWRLHDLAPRIIRWARSLDRDHADR